MATLNVTRSGGSTNDAASDADADAASDSVLPGKGTLGASCTDDSQCGADGSVCLKATDAAWVADGDVANGTGPAGGYCSVDCSDYYDGLTDVDPCAALGGYCYLRWCLEGCSFGTDDGGTKCHGRKDVACASVPLKTGFSPTPGCYPVCSPSSDCGPGRVCDPQRSRCVDAAKVHTGAPDGAACATTADAGYPGCGQCAGSSLSVAAQASRRTAAIRPGSAQPAASMASVSGAARWKRACGCRPATARATWPTAPSSATTSPTASTRRTR